MLTDFTDDIPRGNRGIRALCTSDLVLPKQTPDRQPVAQTEVEPERPEIWDDVLLESIRHERARKAAP